MREINFIDIAFKAVMYSESLDKYFVSDPFRVDSGLACLFGFENKGLAELEDKVLCSQKFINEIQEDWYERDWAHIGNLQYTGLKDKNGVEIYRDNVVRDSFGRTLQVVWNDNFARYEFKILTSPYKRIEAVGNTVELFSWFVCKDNLPEIIGNIYENPEIKANQ